jgi:hypothetical protein
MVPAPKDVRTNHHSGLWIKFFTKTTKGHWKLRDKDFFALEDDVGRVLHHPFIIVIGSINDKYKRKSF